MARDYWFSFNSQPSAAASLAPTFITFLNGSGQTIAPPSVTETYSGSGLYKVNYHATQTIAFVLDGFTTSLGSNRYIPGVFDPQDMFGNSLISIGTSLTALGNTLVALGTTNVALGTSNIALGTTAVAYGSLNFALGTTNVALGTSNVALGVSNLAFGASNLAQGTTILSWVSGFGTSLVAQGASLVAIGDTLSVLATYVGSTASTFGDSSTDPSTMFGYAKRVVEFLEGNQTYTKSTGGLVFYSRGSSYTIASKTVADSSTATTKS